uniref:Putative secreted protein n=1 Tax=Ixodes ricinus TaxID=34613 RepID=A0A6B0TZ72_IXORI
MSGPWRAVGAPGRLSALPASWGSPACRCRPRCAPRSPSIRRRGSRPRLLVPCAFRRKCALSSHRQLR